MNVSDLLTLMGHLSLGNDNVSNAEREIFLQYLNLAHFELYQQTASLNMDLAWARTLTTEEGEISLTLPVPVYIIQHVYDLTHHRSLTRVSVIELLQFNPESEGVGLPRFYYIIGPEMHFYPVPTSRLTVKVLYIPQPVSFREETLEDAIPYPLAYHPVLVDGALYYLFQDQSGFKNPLKMAEAKQRWKGGKSRLLAYLKGATGLSLSTFSPL